jgi:protein TonB
MVRGSRRVASVPGQPGKLEHFSEDTSTVVVFAQGAVVRLVGSVKAGQLVGLTNRQTGKEALCRVVNIKNFPDTRGYVEIEFNHPMNGFWQSALPQEAPAAPVPAARKNGSSPLDALKDMDAEQLLRANPKELKAQLLEMVAELKAPESEVSHAVPAAPQNFWKGKDAPVAEQSAASPESVASEDARVVTAAESGELAVENSEAAAPLAEIAEVVAEQPDTSSFESDLEVTDIGVSESEIASGANHGAVTVEASLAAEPQQENPEASSPSAELPLASTQESLVAPPDTSSEPSQDFASFTIDPPSGAPEDLDADLESLLQPLHGLAEPSLEASSTEGQTPEPPSLGETHAEAPELAASTSPQWQVPEEPEQAAPAVDSRERDDLSPEDMWNAGSIVHSNLDRPSAGSSDADMRASEEKTVENARLAELKAALVTPSAAEAMREDGPGGKAPDAQPTAQTLSMESVWNLFRSLNKSLPSTVEESEDDAASYKLFASGAIADVRQVNADSGDAAESAATSADAAAADARTTAIGHSNEEDDSADRSEEESEASEESAADHHERAAGSGRDEEDAPDEDEVQDSEDDEKPAPARPDVVPQWYSANGSAAASKPWGGAGLNPSSTGLSSGAQGTMATTPSRRWAGAKSVLAHGAATLVLLGAGAAAFHTLRPSISYLMRPPAAPPAINPDENAAARDAAVASLTVPPLPADIQARVANSVPPPSVKPLAGAAGSSRIGHEPTPGDTSTPLHGGEGVRAPRVLNKTLPVAPYAASASGISGDVILSVVVGSDGRVATARVLSGPGVLRNAALEAVRQWEYEPALQAGRPVAMQIYVTVNFPRH